MKIIFSGLNIEKLLCSLTALFMVLNCQSVWQNAVDYNFHIYEITFVSILLYTLYIKASTNNFTRVSSYAMTLGVAYYILILLIVIFSVSAENLIRFLSRFLIFPICLIHFSSSISEKRKYALFNSFVNWAAIISWITLFFWLLSTVGLLSETSTINVNWFGIYSNYFNLYFSSPYQMIDWIGEGVRRNIGVFTEGPMFMIVLLFSLLFMLLIKNYYSPCKWKIYGIILALFSTTSVAGYIFLLVIAGIITIHKYKNKKNQIIIGTFTLIFITVVVSFFLMMKTETASYIARVDDYLAGVKCWLNSPIVGNGYENIEVLRTYMSSHRDWNQGFSNTIFSVLAYGGLLFFIPFILPLARGIYYSIIRKEYRLLIFCVVYLGLYFSVISYTFFINFYIWAFLMCVYKTIKLE